MNVISTEPRDASPDQRRLLAFLVGGQAYGIPLTAVEEIVPMAQLSRPPGLPSLVAGFLNLEGTAVVVVNVARLFGLSETALGLYTPLVLLRDARPPAALLVDKVSGIVSTPDSALCPMREDLSSNACARGVVTVNGLHIILLAPERILLEQEQRALAELAMREQSRLDELEATQP